jgi:hypothetical protein
MRRIRPLIWIFLALAAVSGILFAWTAQHLYSMFNGASYNGWALNLGVVRMLELRLLISAVGLLTAGGGILTARPPGPAGGSGDTNATPGRLPAQPTRRRG